MKPHSGFSLYMIEAALCRSDSSFIPRPVGYEAAFSCIAKIIS